MGIVESFIFFDVDLLARRRRREWARDWQKKGYQVFIWKQKLRGKPLCLGVTLLEHSQMRVESRKLYPDQHPFVTSKGSNNKLDFLEHLPKFPCLPLGQRIWDEWLSSIMFRQLNSCCYNDQSCERFRPVESKEELELNLWCVEANFSWRSEASVKVVSRVLFLLRWIDVI